MFPLSVGKHIGRGIELSIAVGTLVQRLAGMLGHVFFQGPRLFEGFPANITLVDRRHLVDILSMTLQSAHIRRHFATIRTNELLLIMLVQSFLVLQHGLQVLVPRNLSNLNIYERQTCS